MIRSLPTPGIMLHWNRFQNHNDTYESIKIFTLNEEGLVFRATAPPLAVAKQTDPKLEMKRPASSNLNLLGKCRCYVIMRV